MILKVKSLQWTNSQNKLILYQKKPLDNPEVFFIPYSHGVKTIGTDHPKTHWLVAPQIQILPCYSGELLQENDQQ